MRHATFPSDACILRRIERRVIQVLRALQAGDTDRRRIARDLHSALGAVRAQHCLSAFDTVLDLLGRHAWHAPLILPPDARGYAEDELTLARFILAATEQRRDHAMIEASFLVSPTALLPLMDAAVQAGLPLLCEECRARVAGRA